jgi:hypothetical protein
MIEHHGNGEHPELQERRRQLRLWGSLAALLLIGQLLGLLRLARDLLAGAEPGSVGYQVVLLVVNGLLGVLVLARVRALRRPPA